MIENKCKHIWKEHAKLGISKGLGNSQDTYKCKKCGFIATSDEVFKFESLENQNKEVKHRIWTYIVSILALIISILTFIYK